REAGDGERTAVLVPELEERGAEAVAEDHGDAEGSACAALRRHLDGDVADGEEQSAGDPLRDRDRAHAAADGDGRDGGARGRPEPQLDVERAAAVALAAAARERDREGDEPEDGNSDSHDLVPRERMAAHARRYERE